MILHQAIAGSSIKIPEQKYFYGVPGAKELKFFMCDLKKFFATAHVPANDKLTMAVRYFRNDVVLRWRTKNLDDESAHSVTRGKN